MLRMKKKLKSLEPTELDFPETPNFLLMKFYVFITEASGINTNN